MSSEIRSSDHFPIYMINKNNLSSDRVCSFFAADGHNHWQSRTDDFKDRQGEKSLFNFHSF